MFAVALPTIALYEVSILIAYCIEKRKNLLRKAYMLCDRKRIETIQMRNFNA